MEFFHIFYPIPFFVQFYNYILRNMHIISFNNPLDKKYVTAVLYVLMAQAVTCLSEMTRIQACIFLMVEES